MDIEMPLMNGFETAKALRAKSPVAPPVLIALTAMTGSDVEQRTLANGFDFYLSKPADVDQILAVYEMVCQGGESAEAIPATVPSLARVEWEHIQRVLTDCHGNISQAARLLGIHRRSLQRKLSKYPPGQ